MEKSITVTWGGKEYTCISNYPNNSNYKIGFSNFSVYFSTDFYNDWVAGLYSAEIHPGPILVGSGSCAQDALNNLEDKVRELVVRASVLVGENSVADLMFNCNEFAATVRKKPMDRCVPLGDRELYICKTSSVPNHSLGCPTKKPRVYEPGQIYVTGNGRIMLVVAYLAGYVLPQQKYWRTRNLDRYEPDGCINENDLNELEIVKDT